MSATLSEGALLAAWEAGVGQPAARKALVLLAATARPENRDAVGLLPVGLRNTLLLAIHHQCFGNRLDCLANCPNCGETLEFGLRVDEIIGVQTVQTMSDVDSCIADLPEGGPWPVVVRAGDYEVAVVPPTGSDLLAVSERAPRDAWSALLARCVLDAHLGGEPIDVLALPQPRLAELVESIGSGLADADPNGVLGLDPHCAECGHDWSVELDVVSFVWAEVDAWARRLLGDVHALACAYGWTEVEVLSVGSARRQFYLEAVGS